MPETSSIGAFILAGGRSLRMGRDKAMLEWHGGTLLDHMVQQLSRHFASVQIVGRGALPDNPYGCGPLGGIVTALDITETEKNFIVAVDLPFLTPDFLKLFKLRIAASSQQVVACRIESAYPLCLGVDRAASSIARLQLKSGNYSIHGFIEAAEAEVIEECEIQNAGIASSIFLNLNTPEDWRRFIF